jgi:catechol-2,3-dioxygenase
MHDLRYRGVKFFSQIQNVPESQVTYSDGVKKRLVYFHDPEGNILELCEYRAP